MEDKVGTNDLALGLSGSERPPASEECRTLDTTNWMFRHIQPPIPPQPRSSHGCAHGSSREVASLELSLDLASWAQERPHKKGQLRMTLHDLTGCVKVDLAGSIINKQRYLRSKLGEVCKLRVCVWVPAQCSLRLLKGSIPSESEETVQGRALSLLEADPSIPKHGQE